MTISKSILKLVVATITVALPNMTFASDQVIKELPTGKDYQPDFKIEECSGIRGIGTFQYDTTKGINAVSDLCIDEESGTIKSAETRSGFQLVSKTKKVRGYEVLKSGRDQYTRQRLTLTADSVWFVDCNAEDVYRLEYYVPNGKFQNFPKYGYAYSFGHTVPSTTTEPLNSTSDNVYLSLRNFSQTGLARKTARETELPEGADFSGSISFDGGKSLFKVDSGLGNWAGDSSGSIEFGIAEGDQWIGNGTMEVQSARLAGHKPREWVSMSVNIPHIRGFILGNDGRQMAAYGLVSGSYVDASGSRHDFHANASFEACFDPDRK